MKLAFHSIHFTPFFGGSAPLADVLRGAGAAGFDHSGLDLWTIDAELAA